MADSTALRCAAQANSSAAAGAARGGDGTRPISVVGRMRMAATGVGSSGSPGRGVVLTAFLDVDLCSSAGCMAGEGG